MKKLIYILFAFSLGLFSCTKVLDVEPTASISSEDAIKDKAGVERALNGAYNALQSVGSYGRNQILVQDLAADNLDWTGTTQDYNQIANNLIAANNGVVDGIWAANYDCINRVNNVIARLPEIPGLSTEDYNLFMGDALFLRGLCHFNLLGYFGGIPIKTQPTLDLTQVDQARNSITEVYQQVISDLSNAELLLPSSRNAGYAGSVSATALLARVYLAAYHAFSDPALAELAISKSNSVINSPLYSLAPAYADLFNGNTTEPIFSVVFDAQNFNRLAQYFFARSLTGRYEVGPSPQFLQSYAVADTARYNASIAIDASNIPYGIKYKDISAGTDRVMVIRLAEMYLIRAEALANTNGDINAIKSDIDTIRSRAGLAGTTAGDYDALKLAIENERRFEFAFEGHRWFDLVRTNRAAAVLNIDPKYTLFPIPLSEMQTNKLMKQNPGY
jgi:hypothetical protein